MKKILYFGDTHLQDAAAYLAGLMHQWGWEFDYVPSDEKPMPAHREGDYGLFILSDYPAANFDTADHQTILDRVKAGAGLLMVGGWESYHGLGGDWDNTPIGDALPVEISSHDDRRNLDQPTLVRVAKDHPITQGLPFANRTPVIGGLNQVQPKPDSETVLEARVFRAECSSNGEFHFQPDETLPLLVTGQHGKGRTTAFLTDVAPHWVGPLVDWGPSRITAEAPGSNPIEVGSDYARFLKQLLGWTGLSE